MKMTLELALLEERTMAKLTLQELESHLWKSADILRGSIDSSDYKSYIFGLLFIKRLSDVFTEHRNELLETHGLEMGELLAEDPEQYQFYVPQEARWHEIRKNAQDIGTAINVAFETLENENKTLEGVLTPIDFNRKEVLTDEVLQRLLQHFSLLNLSNGNLSEPDMLGRAYEYLISKFADDAGKKGGEFYTPPKVVELIVKLIKPEEGMRVYDPTCGSGGMLVQSVDFVKAKGGNPQSLSLYGQEKNLGTWSIAKMNLLLHGLPDHDIRRGDTIRSPKHIEDNEIMLFDRVIANPPFSLKGWGQEEAEHDPFGRFRYGIPSKNAGDFAFVQHMLSSLKYDGKCGVVLPNGALFRGGQDEKIRREIIKDDLIEAIIALPPNLFYGTGIPAVIIVFNKNKIEELKGKVYFIDASLGFERGRNQNYLTDKNIEHILNCVESLKVIEGETNLVDNEFILNEQEGNLNIPRYIDYLQEEENLNISEILNDIQKLKVESNNAEIKLFAALKDVTIDE